MDSRFSQAEFAESRELGHTTLLAAFEQKGATAMAYGTDVDLGFVGRATFVIDKRGFVQGAELTDNPGHKRDEERYLAARAACNA